MGRRKDVKSSLLTYGIHLTERYHANTEGFSRSRGQRAASRVRNENMKSKAGFKSRGRRPNGPHGQQRRSGAGGGGHGGGHGGGGHGGGGHGGPPRPHHRRGPGRP